MDSITIDANNNLQSYTLGGVSNTYTYKTGNKVENINNGTNFTYSDSGLTLSTPNGLTLSYDLLTPLPIMAVSISDKVSFIYDGRGERYQKSDTNTTISYLRDTRARALVEVMTDSSNNTSTTYYVYGPKGLALINDGSTNYVVLRDHLGSVRVVHEDVASSDLSSTNILGYFNYLPYGGLMSANSQQNSSLLSCRYLYTGQEWDSELGLYNYHARQYDPVLSRFYTPDPAHQFASPYVYAGNNPIGFKDVTGAVTLSALTTALSRGAVILGEVHTQPYALNTIEQLINNNAVQKLSIELSMPARVAGNVDELSYDSLYQALTTFQLSENQRLFGILGQIEPNFLPEENMRIIDLALQRRIPVYFHDEPLPANGKVARATEVTEEESLISRNRFSAGYINSENINAEGTLILAGQAHINPDAVGGQENTLHALLGLDDNQIFNINGALEQEPTTPANNIVGSNTVSEKPPSTGANDVEMSMNFEDDIPKKSSFCGSCDIL